MCKTVQSVRLTFDTFECEVASVERQAASLSDGIHPLKIGGKSALAASGHLHQTASRQLR